MGSNLATRGIIGAILIGIVIIALLGIPLGQPALHGVIAAPLSISPSFLKLDIAGALSLGVPVVVAQLGSRTCQWHLPR